MRKFDQGSFVRVSFNDDDADRFSSQWPCSSVRGRGSFTFQKSNGDLVDVSGTAAKNDGSDWVAFSQDCQSYAGLKG